MEREQQMLQLDPKEIAAALECQAAKLAAGDAIEFVLRNEALGISLRLAVHQDRRAVSLYLRGATGFLGLVHIPDVRSVRIDPSKGEVTFTPDNDFAPELSIQRGGVFLVTRRDPARN